MVAYKPMSENILLDIRNLKLYYKFAPQNSSSNVFFATAGTSVKFNAEEFYAKNFSNNQALLDELELSKKQIIKSAKNFLKMMKVVDDASLTLYKGKNTSVIGESGCGKTTLLMSVLNLPQEELGYMNGEILYNKDGTIIDLLKLKEKDMRELRGLEFGLIPQLAKASINPWITIGLQTGEILKERLSEPQELVKEKVIEYLGKVAFPDGNVKIHKYVNQLSGGEAQKVCIAMALISNPKLLLADEIFSGLDTVTQSQIMELLKDLSNKLPFQFLLATHNITAALNISDDISIMYAGQIVESTTVRKFMEEPLHPYTQGLLNALPWYAFRKGKPLEAIDGESPNPYVWPTGCRFSPRCKKAFARCNKEEPPLISVGEVKVACWLYSE